MKKPIEKKLSEKIITTEELSQIQTENKVVNQIIILVSIVQNGIIMIALYAIRFFWQSIAYIYKLLGR